MQQSYKVSESFPFKWISKKWSEGFSVTSMATSEFKWAVVMTRGAGFSKQVSYFSHLSLYFKFVAFCNLHH